MFAYIAGEPSAVSRHKVSLRLEAQKQWPFLTSLDLSTITNETQLASMVRDRIGGKRRAVDYAVHDWMRRNVPPRFRPLVIHQTPSETRWENEGGAVVGRRKRPRSDGSSGQ